MNTQRQLDFDNPLPSFYNTVNAEGKEKDNYEAKAKSQLKIVREFFEERKGQKYTAEQVWKKLRSMNLISGLVPKDSIKRCCSQLKHPNCGILIMLKEMTTGEYNAPNHYYLCPESNN